MKRRPKMNILSVVVLAICISFQVQGAELTGTYKERQEKKGYTPYIKVDSHTPDNITEKLELSGNLPDELHDGTRIWIEGEVITRLTGNPNLPMASTQQPPFWEIIFVVKRCKRISRAFGRPENDSALMENNETPGKAAPPDKTDKNSDAKTSLSLHCSLSGGMRKVQYDHGTLTYTSTLRKDNNAKAMHASLQSFVEVRKRTELNNDQKKKLRKWAEKLAAEDIEEAQKTAQKTMGAARYTNQLAVTLDRRSFGFNHHTIAKSQRLSRLIEKLLTLAQEFTEH